MRIIGLPCALVAACALLAAGSPRRQEAVRKAPTDGLVGHWKLEETEGAEAADASGKGGAGKHVNGPKVSKESRSLAFDGKGAHVQVRESAPLSMKGALTAAAWVSPAGSGEGILVNKEGEYEIGISGAGKIQFALANDDPGWDWVEVDFEVPAGKWTHLAWTYSAKDKSLKVYANAKEVFSGAGSGEIGDTYPDQNELWIGGRSKEGGAEFFAGRIADVRLYNRALNAGEVKDVWSSGAAGRDK